MIKISENAAASLKGGSINYLWSLQYTTTTGADPHIDLYAQPGWSWLSDDPLLGVEGLWEDGTSFAIEFINDDTFGYDPVWTNINVVEVPGPATVFLLGIGGLLLRRKR